jgi:hypothetical protein
MAAPATMPSAFITGPPAAPIEERRRRTERFLLCFLRLIFVLLCFICVLFIKKY